MSSGLKKVSIISCAIYLCFFLPSFFHAAHAADETAAPLATITRMLGFEPHPSIIDVPGRFMFQGKPVSAGIELLEIWNPNRSVPALEKLGFKLRLFSGSDEVAVVDIPAQPVNAKKIKKDGVLATGAGNAAGLTVIARQIEAQGKHVSGLTLDFIIRATGEDLKASGEPAPGLSGTAPAASDTQPPASSQTFENSIRISKTFAGRADAMAANAVSGKALLYRKALTALPAEADSPEIAALRAEITAKLEAIQSSPAKVPATPAPAVVSATASTPSLSSSTVPERHVPSAEVKSLFEQAQKAFDRQEDPAARDFLRQATEKDPAYFEAWLLLGKNAVGNSKYARAREALETALSLRNDDAEAGALYFKACYYLGEAEIGIEKLFGMVGRKPDAYAPRMALADAYYQAGDLPMCEEQCLLILDKFPGNDRARDLLAKTRERMK